MSSQIDVSENCFFKNVEWLCHSSNTDLSTAGPDRVRKIIQSSKLRGEHIHENLEKNLHDNENYSVQCHRSCVSTYTSKSHINRRRSKDHTDSSIEALNMLNPKRARRSVTARFEFQKNCLICGEECSLDPDPRNPSRWKRVVRCRTADQGKHDFKQVLLDICRQRDDDQAEQVRLRLEGAVSDLHAADAIYHKQCYSGFAASRSVKSATRRAVVSVLDDEENDVSFTQVTKDMKDDPSRIWNSVDLYNLYLTYNGTHLTRRTLMSKLKKCFGEDLLILSGNGVANLIVFRSKASNSLRLVDDEDDDIQATVEKLAKIIIRESKNLKLHDKSYQTRIDLQEAMANCSSILLLLLQHLSVKLDSTLPAALIGNIITSSITNQATTLQIALGILLRDKSLITHFHNFGVSCTYDEVIRFKASAAAAASKQSHLTGLMNCDTGLVQAVADNFDTNISSPNGIRSTHALALLMTQVQQNTTAIDSNDLNDNDCIPRLKKEELKDHVQPCIEIHRYSGPKKPLMPLTLKTVLPLKILASQIVALNRARDIDCAFLKSVTSEDCTPEFGGFNTCLAREQGHSLKPATKAVYRPLIDMTPSDPDTMLTAMIEAQRLTHETGQVFTIFTADQQLYRVVVEVTWVYPDLFHNFIPRLGGMHMLMSFVGAVGTLMSNTGLEEIMRAAFGGIQKMLAGKKFPQNCRALRMIVEELLHFTMENMDTYDQLISTLEGKAEESRTAKLWLDNLVKPVLVMMVFIRSEREGDWPLHLWAVTQMIPYFFAAGHSNYAR